MPEHRPPPRRDQIQAILLAALCSALFLGGGLVPGTALVPFVPEKFEPAATAALRDGTSAAAELGRGNPSMGDKYNQSLAWDRITRDRLRAGELPLWTRDIAGGAPFVPQMAQVYQPWNLLLLVIPSTRIYGLWFLLHQVLFGWLAYRFLRRVGPGHQAALLGVACVVSGLWLQARIHHNVIVSAALPLFAMLSCVHALHHERRSARPVGLLALGTGISWLGGFAVVSVQVCYLVAGYALLLAVADRRLRTLLLAAGGMALGSVISLPQMVPTLLAAAETSRAAADTAGLAATALEADHLLTLCWPDLLQWPVPYQPDHSSVRPSWAALALLTADRARLHNYPETVFAIGVPGLIAACCGVVAPGGDRARRRLARAAAAVAAGGFLLAAALPPLLQLSAVLPGARAGDLRRWLFVVAMALPVLAALGADAALAAGRSKAFRAGFAAVAAASLLGGVLHALPSATVTGAWIEWLAAHVFGLPAELAETVPGLQEEALANRAHLLQTFARALLVAALALLAAWRWRRWSLPLLTALTVAELTHAGHGTVVAVDAARVERLPAVLEPVRAATAAAATARPRLQRVVTTLPSLHMLLPPNLGAFHGLEDLSAYDPLPPRRMEELFLAIEPDREGKPSVAIGGAGVNAFRDSASAAHPLLDVLGVEWLLCDTALAAPGIADATPAGTPAPFALYRRTTCAPRATFVDRARVVADRAERLAVLSDRGRDAVHEVVLEDPAAPPANGDGVPDAEVEITEHRDQRVVVSVRNREPGYLRLADPYDAGWTARVDGRPAVLLVADHYLRAVRLEPGDHTVEFAYDRRTVTAPPWIGLAAALAAVALVVAGRRRGRSAPALDQP